MYTKEELNEIFVDILKEIEINSALFAHAKTEYENLGKWISKKAGTAYQVSVYPQGSFALDTVIKPITETDDYDVDLVCEFENGEGITAGQLKQLLIRPWLEEYRPYRTQLEEKPRCWHVEYEDLKYFHLDVVPALSGFGEPIEITHSVRPFVTYRYLLSNPKGYRRWFESRCQFRWNVLAQKWLSTQSSSHYITAQADIEHLVDRHAVKTPLQQTIELLKRHRDILFKDHSEEKPASIVITTLAATLYDNEDNIVDTLQSFLEKAASYLNQKRINGQYYLQNPSCLTENFVDKWNQNPERATAFFEWLSNAQKNINPIYLQKLDRVYLGKTLKKFFGEKPLSTVLLRYAQRDEEQIKKGALKVNGAAGTLSLIGTLKVPPHHHYGSKKSHS